MSTTAVAAEPLIQRTGSTTDREWAKNCLVRKAEQVPTWSKQAAQQAVMQSVTRTTVIHYMLETWTQSRKEEKTFVAVTESELDESSEQTAIDVWAAAIAEPYPLEYVICRK